MRFLHAQQVLSLITYVSAFAIRDAPLNLTTTAPWDPAHTTKIATSTTKERPFFKPHLESEADGFDNSPTTTIMQNVAMTQPPKPDIGSLIQSYLSMTISVASEAPQIEQSEDNWEDATLDPSRSTGILHSPHLEATADGSDGVITVIIPSAHKPGVSIPQITPPPAVTQGGVTLRPVPVTSIRILNIDGKTTAVSAVVDYRYVVGSAILAVGIPTIIDNVIVALSIDMAGSTILVAGDRTTTLSPAAQGVQTVQATDGSQAIRISTTVIEGTTKYVLAGQTLAPGQAVTVGDVPISIGTIGGSTVLVLGDVTTTLPMVKPATPTGEGASATTTPVVVGGDGNTNPATTSVKAEASNSRTAAWLLARAIGIVALVQRII